MTRARSGRDVVFCLVSDTFTDSIRRDFYSTADQMLLSLVASENVRRVLVVDHPRGVLSQAKRRIHGDRPVRRSGKLRGVRPWTLVTEVPRTPEALARRYGAFDAQIAAAVARARMRSPFLVTFNLFHAAFGARLRDDANLFYAQDDETAIPRLADQQVLLRHAYERVAERYANVAAVSGELLGRIAPRGNGLVVSNGIDPQLWLTVPPRAPARAQGAAGQKPVAAYAGTVDARLDVAALEALADAGFRVVVAGPVADAGVGARLARCAELVGTLSRSAIAHLLVGADLCVLAHVQNELTAAMSPLKLFEYAASGSPIVATDLPGVREAWPKGAHGQLVMPGGDYVAGARAALAQGPLTEEARRGVVDQLSWRRRHDPVLDLL